MKNAIVFGDKGSAESSIEDSGDNSPWLALGVMKPSGVIDSGLLSAPSGLPNSTDLELRFLPTLSLRSDHMLSLSLRW